MKIKKTFLSVFVALSFLIGGMSIAHADVDFTFDIPVNPPSPNGTITVPNCTILVNQSTCTTTISWSTSDSTKVRIYFPGKDPAANAGNLTQYVPGTLLSNANTSGSGVPYTNTLGSTTFNLFDVQAPIGNTGTPSDGYYKIDTAVSTTSCAAGSTWNGSLCAGPGGVITANPTSCVISLNQSSCNTNLTWNVTNPIGGSTVTRDGFGTISSASSCAGCSTAVPYGNQTYRLYNNGNELSNAAVTANCGSNIWDGAKCVAQSALANISTFGCTIALNASTCNSANNVNWSSTNAINPIVKQESTTFSNLGSGVTTRTMVHGLNNFYIYDGATLLNSTSFIADCSALNMWDGTKCTNATATITAADCTIPLNSSTCPMSVSWTSNNPPSPIVKQDGAQFSTSPNSGSSRIVTFGSHTFSFWNGPAMLVSKTANASCDVGSVWDSTAGKCLATAGGSLNSSLGCTIAENASTCPITVAWNTSSSMTSARIVETKDKSTSSATSNIISTAISTVASPVISLTRNISYGVSGSNRTDYELFDMTSGSPVSVDTDDSEVTCAVQTSWNTDLTDGVQKCLKPKGTLRAYDKPIVSGGIPTTQCTVPVNGSNCYVYLKWTITYPIDPTDPASNYVKTLNGNPNAFSADGNTNIYDNTTGHAPTGITGTDVSIPVITRTGPGGGDVKTDSFFSLYSGGVLLKSIHISAYCAPQSGWDGSMCAPTTGTLTSSLPKVGGEYECQITPGQSICSVPFDWNVQWAQYASTSVVTRAQPVANTIIGTGDTGSGASPITITNPASSVTFYLYNDDGVSSSILLDTLTVHAVCAPGGTWNGGTCLAPPPALSFTATPTTPPAVPYRYPVRLNWSAFPATSCTGVNFSTGATSPINGPVIVRPRKTTTYGLSCENYGSVTTAVPITVQVDKVKTIYTEN